MRLTRDTFRYFKKINYYCHLLNLSNASVGFGIDIDSFAEPNNDFRQFGRSVFGSSCFKRILTRFLIATAPGLIRTFKIKVLNEEEENFLTSVVKQNLEYREKNNVVRKDFFQLLIQLRNTGTVHLDDEWNTEIKGDENQKQMTLDEIKVQYQRVSYFLKYFL